MPEPMTLYVFALVSACLVAVGAMFTALRALENAGRNVREAKLRSQITAVAVDSAILRDDVDSVVASMKKLRNRDNARRARESNSGRTGASDTDADFLKSVERDIFKQRSN